MSNPFADSTNEKIDSVKNAVKDQTVNETNDEVSAPLKESPKMARGFEICEDGSILAGTPNMNIITRNLRQVSVDILGHKPKNKIIMYGEGAEVVGDIFINEHLNSERVGEIVIDYGRNILEIGRKGSLRYQISKMKNATTEYNHYKLFNPNNLSGSKNVINRIVREAQIGIKTCYFYFDESDYDEKIDSEAKEYLEIFDACDVNDYNIPVVLFIESFDITEYFFDYADIVINVDIKYEEDRRIEVACIKPDSSLFEPFYLYEDGTYVAKSDSLKPEIIKELGKRVIHPED